MRSFVFAICALVAACASGGRSGRSIARHDAAPQSDSGVPAGADGGTRDAGSSDGARLATCEDGFRNGDESDVDCGGSCAACGPSQRCASADDCTSRVCTGALCQMPGCSDGVHNGDESDVDCGGACAPCAAEATCRDDTDCASGSCTAGVCSAPSCTDGLRNGDETDADCGGSCSPCPDGRGCTAASDCASGTCTGGTCATAPSVTVEFPSATSTVCSAGSCTTLGAGGSGAYYRSGDYVEQVFTATGLTSIGGLAVTFDMDDLTSGCAVGQPLSWNVRVNGAVVGTYGYTGGSAMRRFTTTQSYTFAPVAGAGAGNEYTLRFEATTTVCPGGSSWNWFPGGMATLSR